MLNRLRNLMARPGGQLPASQMPFEAARIPGTDKVDVSAETLKKYHEVPRRLIEFFGRDVDVTTLTRQDYREWHDWLATRGVKAVTVNSVRRRARGMWNRLRERGWNLVDISGLTKMEPEPLPAGKAISHNLFLKLVNTACVRDAAIMWFTLQGGFRRQSVKRFTVARTKIWAGQDGTWRIVSELPSEKAGRPRCVYGGHQAALAVRLWLDTREYESKWLFNSLVDGEPLTDWGVSEIWRTARKRANISTAMMKGAWHSLRYAFAADQLTKHDAAVVAQFMNISVNTLLAVYAVRTEDELQRLYYNDPGP